MVICEICKKPFRKITPTHLKKHNITIKEYIKQYGVENITDDDLKKECAITKENFIKKYGYEQGIVRWSSYVNIQAITNTFKYKQAKYGWTRQQFNEYNKSRSVTKKLCIKRHGIERGLKLWKNYCNRQSITKSEDYVIKKYGKDHWNNLCNIKASTLDNFKIRYGKSIGYKKWTNWKKSNKFFGCISKIEKEFSNELIQLCKYKIITTKHIQTNNRYYFVDVYIPKKNKIIEFFGDYWHANPQKYEANFKFKRYIHNIYSLYSSKDIWNIDEKRLLEIKQYTNAEIKIIWENDYRQDKNKLLLSCLKWINM